MDIIIDSLLDALKDGLLSIPVLFLAYLLMEMLERSQRLNEDILRRYSRKAGPALGSILGIIPQCGISGAAATLFSTGSITVGTMLAVFFATSDEMLPIMLSSLSESGSAGIAEVGKILLVKVAAAVILGYAADLILNKCINSAKNIHSFCEREGCECEDEEGSVLSSALSHTAKIAAMLIVVTFCLNLLIALIGADRIASTFINAPILGEAALSVFGLIPNCSVSVILTRAYMQGIISVGGLFSGLLSNAGIGLLVLLRSNKNSRENVIIMISLVILSFIAGTLIGFSGII